VAALRALQPALRRRVRQAVRAASLVALIAAGPARADVFDDNPATASRGPGDAYIFARAADGAILERHLSGGTWTPWASLGGSATSGPAAVALQKWIYVFARDPQGRVAWNRLETSGAWAGWRDAGGFTTSAPAAATRRNDGQVIDLAVKAADGSMTTFAYALITNTFTSWTNRAWTITAAPAVSSPTAGTTQLWGRTTDGAAQMQAFDGNQWLAPQSFGGALVGAPAAVSRATGFVNLYARSTDNAVWMRSWSASAGWNNWAPLDTRAVESAPAGAGDGADHEWIVARGGSGLLFKDWHAGTGWSAWTDMGPVAVGSAGAPPATTTPPKTPSELDIPAATGCTIHGDKLRVRISLRQVRGKIKSVRFSTRGKGATSKTDRRKPFDVHLQINRPAGSRGRVYARITYRLHGKLRHKTVSGRYTVCR
jgi:hypothetical protein